METSHAPGTVVQSEEISSFRLADLLDSKNVRLLRALKKLPAGTLRQNWTARDPFLSYSFRPMRGSQCGVDAAAVEFVLNDGGPHYRWDKASGGGNFRAPNYGVGSSDPRSWGSDDKIR
eukprot:Skav203061  [mRNA]  locus=scaffold4669:74208:76023:- [translate_table: standard]